MKDATYFRKRVEIVEKRQKEKRKIEKDHHLSDLDMMYVKDTEKL